jgi:sulfur-carrier protein
MQIKVLYFAKLREQLGCAEETISLPPGVRTVGALRAHLQTRGQAWQTALAPGKLAKAAVNHSLANETDTFSAGAEVAFFPPVTGG